MVALQAPPDPTGPGESMVRPAEVGHIGRYLSCYLRSHRPAEWSYLLALTAGADKLAGTTGIYEDRLRKVDGDWRFSERHIAVDPTS